MGRNKMPTTKPRFGLASTSPSPSEWDPDTKYSFPMEVSRVGGGAFPVSAPTFFWVQCDLRGLFLRNFGLDLAARSQRSHLLVRARPLCAWIGRSQVSVFTQYPVGVQ
jgi:hypothetical protein